MADPKVQIVTFRKSGSPARLAAVTGLLMISTSFSFAQEAGTVISKTPVARVQTNPIQGKTAQVQEMKNTIILRVGGFIYKKAGALTSASKFQRLSGLSGMQDLVRSMRVVDETLWVAKDSSETDASGQPLPESKKGLFESQLLYSQNGWQNGGRTFQSANMDSFKRTETFEFGKFSQYAPLDLIREITVGTKKGLVINAGGGRSAWITFDKGNTWKSLIENDDAWSADTYTGSFHLIGNRMLFGGEEPLDSAYLEYGELTPAGTIAKLIPAQTPNLENRRIQFIDGSPFDPSLVFAGLEGGLARSTDGGLSWSLSYSEDEASTRGPRAYPYINQILFPCPETPNVVLAGGQPQLGQGTLLISQDSGKTWKDVSDSALGVAEFLGMSRLSDGTLALITRAPADENLIFSDKADVFALKMSCGK